MPESLLARARRARLIAWGRLPGLRRLETSVSIDLDGRRVVVPVVGGVGSQHRAVTDSHLLPAVAAALEIRDGAFVDVGAHTGETLVKLLVLDPARAYVGFEPQLGAADYVRRLLRANRHDGIVIGAALGQRSGPATLLFDRELDDGATVIEGFRPGERYGFRQVVPMLRGDDALEALAVPAVGVLKVDAEGAELEVLRGLETVLSRDRPPILCEILPAGDPASEVGRFRAPRIASLLELMDALDYRAMAIAADGSIDALDPDRVATEFSSREHAFVPAADVDRFVDLVAARGA